MQVDLSTPKVTFINMKNNKSRTIGLNQHYAQKAVYVFAAMGTKGATAEIIE